MEAGEPAGSASVFGVSADVVSMGCGSPARLDHVTAPDADRRP